MKLGDIVTLRQNRTVAQLLSDAMENNTNVKSVVFGSENDFAVLRQGEVATVIEVNQGNKARVKILYKSGMWWGNISDLVVIEQTAMI